MGPDYDYDIAPEGRRSLSPASAQFTRYEEFLSRELPLRVRSHLEAAVDRALEPLEEGLLNQLVEIVQTAQRELFQSFQAQRLTQREPEANPRRGVANTQDSQENTLETEETDLAVFSFPPLMFDEDWFDPNTFSFQIPLSGSDSGYGSLERSDSCNVNKP
jgi:hypothetical protein